MSNIFIKLKSGKTNSYLIKADNGYLLIDTGYEANYSGFLKEITDNDIKLKEINYLLLTHHHDDHSGFVKKLLNDCELKIIVHENAEKLLSKGENDKTNGGGIINRKMYFVFKFGQWFIPNLFNLNFPPLKLRGKDVLVNKDNNDILKRIGIKGNILFTPGHTIDSISLLMTDGSLFCGDLAANLPSWLDTKYCPPFVTDLEQLYKSWQNIIDSRAQKIYPAHGEPFEVEKLRSHIDKYENEDLIRFF